MPLKNKNISVKKEVAAFLIRYSGVPFLIRNIYARNKCCILLYHNPAPNVLDKHLSYLSRRYNIITLQVLVDAIRSKDWARIPPRSMVITLDDGHKGNFELLGVFRKYKVRPTIYLTSGLINTNRCFWFMSPGVQSGPLKKCANSERLRRLEEDFGFTPAKEYPEQQRQSLNVDEIRSMQDFVDFQAHTCFHPILTTCSDNECKQEIFQCKSDLKTLLDIDCRHFCYPDGAYTAREIELVKKAGFLSARTADVGWNDVNTDPYRLKAIEVPNNASLNMLVAKISGIPGYICYLRMGSFTGKRPVALLQDRQQ
jgi:peptidoglycan/xylan/chitin deacetylase (PgdA/CDA1 family)